MSFDPMMRPLKQRLTVEDAAVELGCSVRTIYLWMKGRGLPYHKGFKRGNYFVLAELHEWARRMEAEAELSKGGLI